MVGALVASGALALGSLPAWAEPTDAPADAPADAASCVNLQLDNPHPGDTLSAGKYTMSGRAVDTSGAAIDRVQIFLENRDLGGTPIGEADLNPPQSSPALVAQSSLGGNGAFSVLTDLSSSNTDVGPHTVFAYARSSNGPEAVVAVPIVLGTKSGGAGGSLGSGQPFTASNSADCPAPAAATTTTSSTGENVSAVVNAPAPAAETINVTVDSPHPGATITRGRFQVQGRATSSAGPIDRVQVFLGNRDLGGIQIGDISTSTSPKSVPNSNVSSTLGGDGSYSIIADFPSQNLGVQTVFVYAHSATTGKEASANTSVTVSR